MFSVARSIFKFDWNNNDKIYNSCDYFLFFDYFIISREKDKTTVFCCDVLYFVIYNRLSCDCGQFIVFTDRYKCII